MKHLVIFFLFIIGGKLFSQDQLFKKDNSKHEVKVLEVTPDEIKYKLKANPNGPLYIVKKSDVALVIYENGTHETYPDAKQPSPQTITIISPYNYIDSTRIYRKRQSEKQFIAVTKYKNVAFVNTLGFLNSGLSLSYLREFQNGLFDIHIPISFSAMPITQDLFGTGFSNYSYYNVQNYKITQKSIDIGLGLYINTSGHRAITHFIGPLVRFAQYNGTFQSYEIGYNPYPYTSSPKTHGFVVNDVYIMLNTGFLYRITPHFNMMLNGAVGFVSNRTYLANNPKDYNYAGSYDYTSFYSIPVFQLGFSAGYRF